MSVEFDYRFYYNPNPTNYIKRADAAVMSHLWEHVMSEDLNIMG